MQTPTRDRPAAFRGAATKSTAREEFDAIDANWAAVRGGNMTLRRISSGGLDLSGMGQGAGGVGGLLMIQDGGNSYLPMYDATGNIHGMIKASDGSIAVSAYGYDAFGNTLRESGTYTTSNSFRYSTKYTDIETGLVYYGLTGC